MLSVAAALERGSFALNARFDAPTPGVVALFGRSGSGKTTVVNVIAGLTLPASGRVALDDTVLLDTQTGIVLPPERRRIGYVFQDARLFPHLRVAGNLRYALRRAAAATFIAFDEVVGLLDLGSLLHRRTHQLSGGERQRVAIGRALLTQPRLLLLDEPLAGLDRARREEVLPYLESLRDQLSIPMVYVTHAFDEVWRLATHVVLMESGAAVAQGSVETMSLDPRLRALIGPDEVGAVVEGTVLGIDPASRLTRVLVGRGELQVPACDLPVGASLRVQLLARDLIVSTRIPEQLSVRNNLRGVVVQVQADAESDLITIDVGAARVLARVTRAATRDLGLRAGLPVWALVKSVALRGRSVTSPAIRDA